MAEDPKTRSLVLCVLDGHGEDGDKVAQYIKGKLANYLFKHRDFAIDVRSAVSDTIAKLELEVLQGTLLLFFLYYYFMCTSLVLNTQLGV